MNDWWEGVLLGAVVGAWLSHVQTWQHARKIEDLIDGGLRAWDDYERANAQAKGQGKWRFPRVG